ncbi:hypothetical protein RIB2604_01702370 [Aspergillus luchuensis]|uniref:SNF2 N-terminal domain-containing protein n=1 Tax=Aspergillus kawachii TaxID=1069201 RepID=A0A146FCB0_ASPKA|nr:hypothetical protein RIB2604_01702370 [Aspergillus luchuensis]
MNSALFSSTPDSNQSTTPESHTNDVTPPFHLTKNICSPRKHPAGVNFQNRLIKPNEDLQSYLDFQLLTPKLNRIHHMLWLAGLPRAARPLHRQKLMKRTVILTESPDEHLVWSPGRILIKPVPEYLLDHKFWVRNICPNRELYAAACGLLLSYAWLIAGLIDFRIAKNEHILPNDVKWKTWTKLVQEVLEWKDKNYDNDNSRNSPLPALSDPSVQPQPAIINKRYEFGELRLSRLNYIYRLTPSIFSIRNLVLGFMPGSTWYQEFFERHFSWILAVLVYLSVLLSAMQVGLATDTLQGNRRFQKSCTVFALASIFFTYLLLNFPDEMSSDSSQKRVVESVDDIHDTDSDGHRGKRSKIDKPFTSGSSSVRDTETSPSSLVSENKVHVVLRPKGDQAGGDSEAICEYNTYRRAPPSPPKWGLTSHVMPRLYSTTSTFAQTFGSRTYQLTQPQRGRRELQLRCPVPKPDQIRYYNPQWSYTLGPPPSEQLKPPHTPRIANQKELNGSDEAGANKPNDFEDDRGDAQAVLECSSQQNLLNEACIDSRIQTELKSHQLEAVNFILSRETIYPHSSKKTLWRLENLDSGERVYKHEITGKISSRPEDIRGGILADDMGLGKTLSMIASIVTGLSCVEATLETPADTIPVPVKSTLVVVPTEPHYIRNEDTLAFQAVNSLSASIRWCTTGTPIQNSLHDLASLVRFLRVPYLDSHAAFHEHIAKLSSSASADDICHRPHRNLELLLAVICLRRRFSTLFPDLQSTAITYRLSFSEVERRAYNELTRGCNGQLMAAVSMRMFCNTGMSSICLGGEVKDYDGDDQRSSLDTVVTLPQRGEVNIRSTYNTKILTSDSEDDVSDSQPSSPDSLFSLGPRHTLECQAFAQTKAGLVGEGESLYDLGTPNTTTTTTAATTPLPCDNEMEDCGQSEIAGPGFPLLVDMSQAGFIYPSKLVTLLANIRENYLEDKR